MMHTERLIRAAGLATLVGSALLALFPLAHPNHDPAGFTSWRWIPAHLLAHLAAIAYLFGLPALYVRQGERNGWVGLAGYVLATLGTAQLLMVAWVELFVMPFIALRFPALTDTPPPGVDVAAMLMQASLAVGYSVLGLGVVRAGVLPRGAGLLLVIAAPLFGLGDLLVQVVAPGAMIDTFVPATELFAVAMGALGLALWRGQGARQQARAGAGAVPGLGGARLEANA